MEIVIFVFGYSMSVEETVGIRGTSPGGAGSIRGNLNDWMGKAVAMTAKAATRRAEAFILSWGKLTKRCVCCIFFSC